MSIPYNSTKKPLMKRLLLVVLFLSIASAAIWLGHSLAPEVPPQPRPSAASPIASVPTPLRVSSLASQTPRAVLHVTESVSPALREPLPSDRNHIPIVVAPPRPTPTPTPEIVFSPGNVDRPDPKERTVAARLRQYGSAARARLAPRFRGAGVTYPPAKVLLVGLKEEGLLKVYAQPAGQRARMRFICQYPIVASGPSLGPKLREGDRMTPEGVYHVTFLNPESSYHLSMAINYPNAFDQQQARRDKRTKPGCDIMIHGFYLSDGCLAMGDTAATDLFVLVSDAGTRNTEIVLSPVDFRLQPDFELEGQPAWTRKLYADLRDRMTQLEDGVSTEACLIRYRDTVRPPDPNVLVEKTETNTGFASPPS